MRPRPGIEERVSDFIPAPETHNPSHHNQLLPLTLRSLDNETPPLIFSRLFKAIIMAKTSAARRQTGQTASDGITRDDCLDNE